MTRGHKRRRTHLTAFLLTLHRGRGHDRAGNGTRTRDPNLGKVVLYQLSYSRIVLPNPVEVRGIEPLTS